MAGEYVPTLTHPPPQIIPGGGGGGGSAQMVTYTSGTPAAPTDPTQPAVAYDPTGVLPTLGWNPNTLTWN